MLITSDVYSVCLMLSHSLYSQTQLCILYRFWVHRTAHGVQVTSRCIGHTRIKPHGHWYSRAGIVSNASNISLHCRICALSLLYISPLKLGATCWIPQNHVCLWWARWVSWSHTTNHPNPALCVSTATPKTVSSACISSWIFFLMLIVHESNLTDSQIFTPQG